MTPDTYKMLHEWLEIGDDLQKQHAKHRLSLPDAVDYRPPKPEYPSWLTMAGNATKAATEVVSAIAHGKQIVRSEQEQIQCLTICHACKWYDPDQERCRECGCYLNLKVRLASWHCPLDPPKW
jgi:hypothetical protein